MRRSLLLALAAMSAASPPLRAQEEGPEPVRPRLDAGRDTNDARAYYVRGIAELAHRPDRAADAFYWAARLDPSWADAIYARSIALLMEDPRRLVRYVDDPRSVASDETHRIDSLQYQALSLDPLFFSALDDQALRLYVRTSIEDELRRQCPEGVAANSAMVDYVTADFLRVAGPRVNGWVAYSRRRFPAALEYYARASAASREASHARAARARIFAVLAQYDSALKEMDDALADVRPADRQRAAHVYDSKAMYAYSLGVIRERVGDRAGAREAYRRALDEGPSLYMARARLGDISLTQGDTAAAVLEYEAATRAGGADPALRHRYGLTLVAVRRYAEAETQFRKAIEYDPDFAAPYFYLAAVLEAQGKAEALEQFRAYAARAPRGDRYAELAKKKLVDFAGWSRNGGR